MPSIETEMRTAQVTSCYICSSQGAVVYVRMNDQMYGGGSWIIKGCMRSHCRLLWLDPMPVEEDINKAYLKYYTHHDDTRSDVPKKALLPSVLKLMKSFLNWLTFISKARNDLMEMYLGAVTPGRLLEIGCGNGKALQHMRTLGWVVEGLEVDQKAAEMARQQFCLDVHVGPSALSRLPSSTYDAIIMNHVVEHLYDPAETLRESHRLLKPGGSLVVVTPNVLSLGHRLFGRHWRGLDPPRHLHLFSLGSLEQLGRMAGFTRMKSFTTAINADMFASGSIEIKQIGLSDMVSQPGLLVKFKSALFLYLAMFLCLFMKKAGEECVLITTKQQELSVRGPVASIPWQSLR